MIKLKKSEMIALTRIKELTIDAGKINTVISNHEFEQKGLIGRHIIIKATNSLVTNRLIFKVKDDDKYFRYQLTKTGTVYLSERE